MMLSPKQTPYPEALMQLTARQQLTQFAHLLQKSLFPILEEELGPLDPQARLLTSALSMIRLDQLLPPHTRIGRPHEDRRKLAAAFLAKAIYGCTTTRQTMARLRTDSCMRRLCGWEAASQLPHESTFSRSFAAFSQAQLPQELHRLLICQTHQHRLVGHLSRDSTAIAARERFPDVAVPRQSKSKSKRNKKGKHFARAKATERGTVLERQRHMTLAQMLPKLSTACSLGVKTTSGGSQQYWRGYKLHLDAADGQIPISAILTGAHVHDSQVAIPLMQMSAQRVTWLYDVMDSAYDAQPILEQSRSMDHVPIVRPHPRRQGKSKSILPKIFPRKQVPEMSWAEQDRFKERTTVERVHARLKDEFGGRHIRVRGAAKVFAHLAFGLLALTVDQLLRLSG